MFKSFVFFTLFTVSAYADIYPKFYEDLGTPLYKADKAFQELSSIQSIKEKSEDYHTKVESVLHFASFLEKDPMHLKMERKEYVQRLRALKKEHDDVLKTVNIELLKSIDADDYQTFSKIITTGLDAIVENNVILKRSMAYYVSNRTRGQLELLDKYYKLLETDSTLKAYTQGHMPRVQEIENIYTSNGTIYKASISWNEKFSFIADGKHCFKVIDIKNFADSSEIASFKFNNNECDIIDLSLSADTTSAYLSDTINGLAILDISDPAYPILKGSYSKLHAIASLSSANNQIIFVIRKEHGLSILDISDADEPRLLANYDRGLSLTGLAVDEETNRLYLSHSKGLSVLDISTLGNPRKIAEYKVNSGSYNVAVSSKRKLVYLASGVKGVQVLNASDNNLSLISSYLAPASVTHLLLSKDENTLFVSASEDGVHQVDTKDSHYIKHVVTYSLKKRSSKERKPSVYSSSLNPSEDALYISYGEDGLAKVTLVK